jgi:hypothetical protein
MPNALIRNELEDVIGDFHLYGVEKSADPSAIYYSDADLGF